MARQIRTLCFAAMCLLLTSGWLSAQPPAAQINGRVVDQNGHAVPGAKVTATHVDTEYVRTDVTDANGSFALSTLPIGAYRLEVSHAGFRTHVQTGIVLRVGTTLVIDAILSIGVVEAEITVEASTSRLDAQTPGISQVVRTEEILALPLNGRNAVDLVSLTGAAVPIFSSGVTAVPGGMAISVAGGQAFGVTYLLDGAIHNNPHDNLNLPFPFPDALREFTVATSGLQAQHGMHSGSAVNAVTRSGANRFSGNALEFFRDRRFNATNPFAKVGANGKRLDDGLQRHQYGGTLGGPIVRNRLFFFVGYQGTHVRQQPAANIAWVPTPAMLAGDFTAIASSECNGGRAITLGGGFVNNRIDPARFSPAALNLTKYLPRTTDPCGQVTYTLRNDNDQSQIVGRLDVQRTAQHSMFGRYLGTTYTQSVPMRSSDTVLSLYDTTNNRGESGFDDLAQSLAVGDTRVFGSNAVHSLRFAFNRSAVERFTPDTFDPYDLGIDAYSYYPHIMSVTVNGGFGVSNQGPSRFVANTAQVANDLTVVRGTHQLSMGGSAAYWRYHHLAHARSGGFWLFSGQATGLGLADFLVGRLSRLEHGRPGFLTMDQWHVGLYVQDTWRVRSRITINGGLRWEPWFGQRLRNGAVYNFSLDNFRNNVTSTGFPNAPAGLIYPGDPGSPGPTGQHTQWLNLSPRVGVGWDLTGDARTLVRASYGLVYDFPAADYQLLNAQAQPFGSRTVVLDPPGRFDRPYAHLGGDPHPITTGRDSRYAPYGAFGPMNPHINSPRVQQWNVTIERQIGAAWQVALSYLGSYTDRLWNQVAINPGVFLGTDPCTLDGVFYPTCSTIANLNQRRVLSLSGANPAAAQLLGSLDLHTDVGTQTYRGLKLLVQRRVARGMSVTGNYTMSRCYGDPALQTGGFPLSAAGYTNPEDPAFDRGACDQDRTHLANLMAAVQTPRFDSRVLRSWASG